jgi:hypothetical protein
MANQQGSGELVRALDWKGAFWVAAGVPPLVLFSIGGIAGTTGKLAFLVWIISMIMGFLQSFTYAEIAGMFGNKSGGASVYGATAWLRYSKLSRPCRYGATGSPGARFYRWVAPSRPVTSSMRSSPFRRLILRPCSTGSQPTPRATPRQRNR